MQSDEGKSAANFLHHRIVQGRHRSGKGGAVANDDYTARRDTFGGDAISHGFAENDYAVGLLEGAATHAFPALDPMAGLPDVAADSHVRIEVANIVNEGAAGHARDECSGNASDGRVGHGQDNVGSNLECARHREGEIGKIIRDAAAHLVARESGGTDALDLDAVTNVTSQEGEGIELVRIIGGASCDYCHFMALRQFFCDLGRHFRGGGSVGWIVFVEQKYVHYFTWRVLRNPWRALPAPPAWISSG